MKKFSSFLLTAAVLGAVGGVEGAGTGTQQGEAVTASCLTEFNTARERADLHPFTAETNENKKLPIEESAYVEKGASVSKTAGQWARAGTYAYAPQTGSTANCGAAVTYWKAAYVNFGDLPPVYHQSDEGVYADSRNRSLVALFNPKAGATVDCAFFTCPIPTTTTTTVSTSAATEGATDPTEGAEPTLGGESYFSNREQKIAESASVESHSSEPAAAPSALPISLGEQTQSQQQGGPSVRRLATSDGTVAGLVCLTNPAALVDGQRPFS
ncbi:SAG family member [Eimeria brunetti]|uniref:SAG family member n=1 Tax=Eimeria brunetti TaxID=51314 RepID=U6LNK0_9EIME|nr:SAG family member [Eimeria brunetti]